MLLLDDRIQPYAWGRVDGLAPLVGTPPTGGPEAELWVGTHPGAPSVLATNPERTLAEVVAADPAGLLGAEVAAAFDGQLPFLLKVLCIGAPLSLQAHPSPEQAQEGFAREDEAGIARDAPDRTYRDASAKPEMLVALVDTWALCGFRPPAEARALVTRLGEPVLGPLVDALAGQGSEAVEAAVGWLLGLVGPERAAVAAALAAHPAPVQPAGDDRDDPFAWVARLAGAYPDDPAMVAPLLLNLVRLAPGEAVHLPAGNLHAYLEGAGVEVMATSDNVLRGGLTPKHVDAAELRRVLHFAPGPPPTVAPGRPAAGVRAYDAGEPAFALMALAPTEAGGSIVVSPGGPALLLATGGRASVQCGAEALELAAGRAVFVGAGEGPVEVSGPGTVWWATSGTAPSR